MSVMIEKDQCTGCGNCMEFCPEELLHLSQDANRRGVRYMVLQDAEQCLECGRCELMCTAAAMHIEGRENGSALLNKEHIPPHSGCSLGSLAKALADVIQEMGLQGRAVLFKKKASDVNMHVESHDYTDDQYFADGLQYKKEHPEKIVILICTCSKAHTTAATEERYRSLKEEKVTLITTHNWFESDPEITRCTAGGSRILEEMCRRGDVSFAARTNVRSIEGMLQLKSDLKTALQKQMNGENFAIVEMTYPCFYRLAGRPQTRMPYEEIHRINQWFDLQVTPQYPCKVLKEQ